MERRAKHQFSADKLIKSLKEEKLKTEEALNFYSETEYKLDNNQLKHIIGFVKYGIPTIEWLDRLQKIKLKRNDCASLESFLNKFPEEVAKEKFAAKSKSAGQTKEQMIARHGLEKTNSIIERKKANTLKFYIDRYGAEEGPEKFKEYTAKRVKTFTERNKHHDTVSLSFHVKRHGQEEGLIRYLEAKKARYRRHDKSFYIEKFGEERGEQEYLSFKEKIRKDMLAMAKRKIELGPDVLVKSTPHSKSSQDFFDKVFLLLPEELQKDCRYGRLNREEYFYMGLPNYEFTFADFKCRNVIVEFNGVYWHKVKTDRTKRDLVKKTFLEEKGYSVLEIEDEYIDNNEQSAIEEVKNFILENIK